MSNFNINEDAQSGGETLDSQSSQNEPPSDNSQPVESAFPDEDEETITMLDVIEREDKLEEEASAVLGNSDEKNCTYPKGYISRQALYSCATCSDGSDNLAAICLACSLECHDNHEVFELYTKRNYRCDCGNSKFKNGFECKLMDKHTKKSLFNENNKYNHNFSGRYCICDKRYPPDENDDSAESQDEMWQCIVCEDWYHTKHLGAKELPTRFDELICTTCVDNLDFVRYYQNIDKSTDELSKNSAQIVSNLPPEPKVECVEERVVSGCESNEANKTIDLQPPTLDKTTEAHDGDNQVSECDTNDSLAENKDPGNDSKSSPSTSSTNSDCILQRLKDRYGSLKKQETHAEPPKGPMFLDDCSWRAHLCRCQSCLDLYKLKGCEFLIDEKDTVQYYEAQGKALAKSGQSPFERGMSALNRMNRVAVVEALNGYDELKANLSTYLRTFADNKKVVREQDIHDFFEQLKSKKRPRLE